MRTYSVEVNQFQLKLNAVYYSQGVFGLLTLRIDELTVLKPYLRGVQFRNVFHNQQKSFIFTDLAFFEVGFSVAVVVFVLVR